MSSSREGPKGGHPWGYVMLKPDGNKGVNYKDYKWRPDWRLPPGVSQKRVFLQLAVVLGLCAIPVWVLPALTSGSAQEKKPNIYVAAKKAAKEERKKWIESDDMPYK